MIVKKLNVCVTKENKIKEVLERPSQSLDWNPTEMLWHYIKQALHVHKSSTLAEFW